jgi:murein DD-endopeptidase MepM/ murein hydrolase activator NlpD
MRSTLAATIGALTVLLAPLTGQTTSVFAPIDVRVPVPPRPFVAGGATHLAYELHITNLSPRPTTLETVDVMERSAAAGAAPLLHLEGEPLDSALRLLGAPPDAAKTRILPGGGTAIVFVWVTLRAGIVPAALTHRFALGQESSDGASLPGGHSARVTDEPAVLVRGVDVPVSTNDPPVVGPPLEGDHWLAANGPDNGSDHRRVLLAIAGQGRIAQRFAIDWVRLFEDGRTFRGDPRNNDSYRAFGAKVLAVADGVVIDTLDGLPENVPDPVARAVPITPASVSGNYILQDLGDAAYAVYAHLQPGSLRVRKGDRVRRGQVLALVGNTGNSSEPHLHFHIADRPSAIDAEGIPYAFASFALEAEPGVVTAALRPLGGSLEIGPSGLAAWKTPSPRRRAKEIPLRNAIVAFLDR